MKRWFIYFLTFVTFLGTPQLVGSTLGSFAGYTAQEIVPRGEIFHIQNLTKSGDISYIPQKLSCRINNFWITYTKTLKTDQFYSDL